MLVPAEWMPPAVMQRCHVHWTAGAHKANAVDKKHYHILIEGDGTVVRGNPSIKANEPPLKSGYAAHTLNANSRAIGVSMCCMAGATEVPFRPGKYPMTRKQWDVMTEVVSELCKRYGIPVTAKTVLTHAEVQSNLGIRQRNKWDITRLPFDSRVIGAKAVGDKLRREVSEHLAPKVEPIVPDNTGEPDDPPLVEPVTSDRPAWAYALFRQLGWSHEASVALIGNAQQESYQDLRTWVTGDKHIPGGSVGIFQWNRSRKADLEKFAKSIGKPWDDLETQVRFADYELRTTEKTWGKLLADVPTIYSANKWAISYLRPQGWSALYPQGGHGWTNRLNNAIALDKRLPK